MALSAADLQRRHELEGAPDPFPSLVERTPKKSSAPAATAPAIDTNSQAAFPSLATSTTPVTASKPTWGSAAGPRLSKAPVFSDSITLSSIDTSNAGKDGKPATLGDVMKQITTKYKVKLEGSVNQKTRQHTFHLKSESQKELDKAKRSLMALLSPVVKLIIQAPVSTIATIIGPKGATLKQIRDQTSVRVDIPRKDALEVTNGHDQSSAPPSGKVTPSLDDEDEPTIPVTLTGPQPLAYEAQALLQQIIASKTSKATQRVRDIPSNILPFVLAKKSTFEEAAEGAEIKLSLNHSAREITVTGDRPAVIKVIETIRSAVDATQSSITSLKISLPKRQHRLLVGKAVDQIMAKSKCAVVVPPAEDPSDEVTVWGQALDLSGGLGAVMEQANSQYIHEFPLPGPITFSRQLVTYMARIQYPKTLAAAHPTASVFIPSPQGFEKATSLSVEIVGEKPAVDDVVRKLSGLVGSLVGATAEVPIDWLKHRVITGKYAKKLKQFHDSHNVNVYFPPESAEQSSVLLVYDPAAPNASKSADDKKRNVDEVIKELTKFAKDSGDIKSQTVVVEKRWHEAVVGKSGTTLNAIIGEEKALSIKVGADANDDSGEDIILVRGTSSDVERAVKEINSIVENAKNELIDNSFSTEFDIDREFVGRIVGSQGAGINKLRDLLGVRVDLSDDLDEKEKELGKKKKATHQRCKVKITGRKENVEEAKRRILGQVERLADETSEVLKIPSQYHSSLIGSGGKYAIRLEDKYTVKITFPRQSSDTGEGKTREQLKADEVLIKGGKKGVAGAKSELLEAVEFEKESNNVIKFDVPTRSVARILGRGGASINEIKNDTDTQIDVDKADDDLTNITIRGSKKNIGAAKAAILSISDQIAEEISVTVEVPQKFHRTVIGPGGKGLKELVTRCGGNADPKVLASLIRFPRQGEQSDEVRLRGDPQLVNKLKVELEKTVTPLKERVVLAVEIPSTQHSALIGRGGQHLNELQDKTGAQVQFPGSRSYPQVGEAENADEFQGVEEANIVKVVGSRAACLKAIEELKAKKASSKTSSITANVSTTVNVPLKYHHAISQQGSFFRVLRNAGVQVDQSVQPSKSAVPPSVPPTESSARIDEDEGDKAVQWHVTANYIDAEEGDSVWTLKGKDQEALDKAQKLISDAIAQASRMSHVGFLTLPDRSMFPRIVGSKGANVSRLRNETGADITVSRENTTIVIIGAESDILAAKDAILRMTNDSGRARRA